jgi:anti-sigma B factor antagonist
MSNLATNQSFSIESVRDGESHTVRLYGEFDLAAVDDVTRELRQLEEGTAQNVIVDLRELEFIDSSGISALVEAQVRFRENGSRLEFLCGPGPVQRVLQMTGVHTLLALA